MTTLPELLAAGLGMATGELARFVVDDWPAVAAGLVAAPALGAGGIAAIGWKRSLRAWRSFAAGAAIVAEPLDALCAISIGAALSGYAGLLLLAPDKFVVAHAAKWWLAEVHSAPAVRFAALLVLLFGLALFREGRVNLRFWWWKLRAAIGARRERVRLSAFNAEHDDA